MTIDGSAVDRTGRPAAGHRPNHFVAATADGGIVEVTKFAACCSVGCVDDGVAVGTLEVAVSAESKNTEWKPI